MKQIIIFLVLMISINQCVSQKGFPKQFQTTLNISGVAAVLPAYGGVQKLLFDYNNLRARFDVQGWRANQSEAYILKYKPEGAETDSPASKGYAMFNFNPDYPELTKNDCWYRTDPAVTFDPFPSSWFYNSGYRTEMKPWFPLPSNLVNKGEQWVPELKINATRYDSPEICDLVQSGIGRVPCLSYFETADRPVQTIFARASRGSFDYDDYIITTYLSFTHGIPSEAEKLFDLPKQWPSFCGNANTGFSVEDLHGYVVTPQGNDNFTLTLQTPPVHALGDQVTVEFKIKPSWFYNGTKCAKFNSIVVDRTNWNKPQKVEMSFGDYGCCNYEIFGSGGGYDWEYNPLSFVVYACDGEAGYGCKGKEPCGA